MFGLEFKRHGAYLSPVIKTKEHFFYRGEQHVHSHCAFCHRSVCLPVCEFKTIYALCFVRTDAKQPCAPIVAGKTESLIFESESETETESEDVGSKKPDVDGTVSDYMRKIGKETETETEPADGIEIETEKEAKRKASSKKTKVKVIRSEAGVLRNLFREKGLKLKPSKYRSIDVDGEGQKPLKLVPTGSRLR